MIGRRNRVRFVLVHIEIVLWCAVLLTPFLLFIIPINTPQAFLEMSASFSVLVFITGLICIFLNAAGRCHDLDMSGWNSLLLLIPLSGMHYKLMNENGWPYENRYGQPCSYKTPSMSYFVLQFFSMSVTFGFLSFLSFWYQK